MYISEDLYGLVVCGGHSSRMGTDKSLLTYYEKPQRYHLSDMLQPLCEKVLISCNQEQAESIGKNYEVLTDLPAYGEVGPMAALLTAFSTYPEKDILLTGCDYPLFTVDAMTMFLISLKRGNLAAAFYNRANRYEPLLAWYSRDCAPLLKAFFERNEFSLQQFLMFVDAQKYLPEDEHVMTSVDTPEHYQQIKTMLEHRN